VKIEKVVRRVSTDGTSVLNAAVAANIGEPGGSVEASTTSVQHVQIVQRRSGATRPRSRPNDTAPPRPTDKES
jgi:hypothetical protein